MIEASSQFEGGEAKHDASEQPDGMNFRFPVEPVPSQRGPCQRSNPDTATSRGGVGIKRVSRGCEQAGMLLGEVAVNVRQSDQGILTRATGDRLRQSVGETIQREQCDPDLKVVGVGDVGIEAGDLHVEDRRERGRRDGIEPCFIG